MEKTALATPITVLEEMRNKIHMLNETSRDINLRLNSKLNHLRGEKDPLTNDIKPEQANGYINETNQIIDFLTNRITETENLLDELFKLM